MKLIDILTQAWAIRQESLDEIRAVIDAHLRGPKLNLQDIALRVLGGEDVEKREYEVSGDKALIEISGVLSRNPGYFERIFYGARSMSEIQSAVRKASDDPSINEIILLIDSPGGTVTGTQDLADEVYNARDKKQITALVNGGMFSAAAWVGVQAHRVYLANETSQAGSIGVIMFHADYSKMYENYGVKVTEIFSGKYKAAGSPYKSLTDEDKQVFQDQLDYMYSIFVDSVARGRGVSSDKVLSDMADARIFTGKQAVEAGLVDGVSTLDQILNKTFTGADVKVSGVGTEISAKIHKEANMDIEKLKAEFPEVFEAVKRLGAAEATAEVNRKIESAKAEGAEAERERVQAVKSQSLPGHEALIETLMFDGKTSGPDAAVLILQAEKKFVESHLSNFRAENNQAVDQEDPEDGEEDEEDEEEKDKEPVEEEAKKAWKKSSKLQAEFGGNFKTYLAFRKAEASGNARVKRG